jgi:hypothetical protein
VERLNNPANRIPVVHNTVIQERLADRLTVLVVQDQTTTMNLVQETGLVEVVVVLAVPADIG